MVDIAPLTVDRWPDFERLFGANGACGGCWCMWWRVSAKEFEAGSEANRSGMRALVEAGPTGLLAYDDGGGDGEGGGGGAPVGWCSVGPRHEFGRIERSPDLAAPVAEGVSLWSVVCFYIARGRRRQGIAAALLDAAVAYAGERGAEVVEGYAVDPSRRRFSNSELYTGTVAMFEAAGFREVQRRKPTSRVVMRRSV